ncbi:hypothetical protein [Nesterenkonia rhizosphaerae]|uniref:Uncharacterized protein n=1 Tax=Nesterenkonia rhizosphaerae TaxID=1348272 RepID=A0ABP9G3C7_9MICC
MTSVASTMALLSIALLLPCTLVALLMRLLTGTNAWRLRAASLSFLTCALILLMVLIDVYSPTALSQQFAPGLAVLGLVLLLGGLISSTLLPGSPPDPAEEHAQEVQS